MMRELAVTGMVFGLGAAVLGAGCGDDDGSGAGGDPGPVIPVGGGGGAPPTDPTRGDPLLFPPDCYDDCELACARLAWCGGDSSTLYPLEEEECLTRCALQEEGYMWPDISQNFKCCTSQESCFDVAHCGGWLHHPDVGASCERMCECFFASAIEALVAGHEAPAGYRFAPDLLVVEPTEAAVDWSAIPGVEPYREGPMPVVRLRRTAGLGVVGELRRWGRVLPTFVDGAGRVSAAVGNVVLVVEQPGRLDAARAVAEQFGLRKHRLLKTRLAAEPDARLYLLEGRDGWQAVDAVAALAKLPGVRAELDQLRHYERRYAPNDPLYGDQWHLHNTGQQGSTPSVDGRVSEAWDVTLGDPQVLVAINDDGVDLDHPDFAGRLEPELNYPADWRNQMEDGSFGWHGSSVAGVAAGSTDNGEGSAGVCGGCRVLPHLLGPSNGVGFDVTDSDIAAGFTRMVDAGAWVINNSWGPSTGDPVYVASTYPVGDLSSVIQASFDYAESDGRGGLGTVILFAAGNSNDVLDQYGNYDPIVSVAAVNDLGIKSYYSSFGPKNDVAAPSNGGINGITTTANRSDYTTEFGGTSSASPFAAGVVGLIFSVDPTLTAAEARAILKSTATPIDPVFGQWDEQEHSDFYGDGLIDAYAAVQLAAGGCTTADDCVAPSDECGASCGTGTQCDPCRTQADCAAGHVCQALPALGRLVCVAEVGSGSCPAGTSEVHGYCLPSASTCGFCAGSEQCNGRDDDCNGEVDEGGACEQRRRCFVGAPACDTGTVCAGTSCVPVCSTDEDCPDDDQSCETLKDQYGAVPGPKGCVANVGASQCEYGCQVLASSMDDAALGAWVECMNDGEVGCYAMYNCLSQLPIEF